MSENAYTSAMAVEHFRRAWRHAHMQDIITRLTGRTNDLLSYEEVRHQLKGSMTGQRELHDIPIQAIVGSVGRYTEFTRTFLPRMEHDRQRWISVLGVMQSPAGAPPIEVYQIGDVYFVLDGNHRVSVARELGMAYIQAYVTPVHTNVPITPDTSPDELIRKAEYADFLELTNLYATRPGADLRVTNPGQYRELQADIDDKRRELTALLGRDVPMAEAAVAWYDDVYVPIAGIFRERGMLHGFPGRTETDLYIWISRHRTKLEATLGWAVDAKAAAQDLVERERLPPRHLAADLGEQLIHAMTPAALAAGPPPGQWRKERDASSVDARLSADLLVAVNGDANGWYAFEQAIIVARYEGGRLNGLHVVPTAATRGSAAAQAVQDEFERRCRAAGVAGNLAIDVGSPAEVISNRARWNDLVVVSLAHPPGGSPLSRVRSGFRALIQRCPRPILAVPPTVVSLRTALLSYDGSPKATEALYVAAYLALQWKTSLVLVTVLEPGRTTNETQEHARQYLEAHGIAATYASTTGPIAEAILRTADEHESELIIVGGYGQGPVREVVLGSTVDHILRESHRPTFICR